MTAFRTIELSDPALEPPGLRFITVKSAALGGRGDITVYVPPQAEGMTDLPATILMHGVYCSHWAWVFKAGAHVVAEKLIAAGELQPMVLVMPSDGLWGDGSGYLPHAEADFERWIVEDVVGCATESIEGLGRASPWCIAGLSMGGYGALRIGARHAGRFRAIGAHSAITAFEQMSLFVEEPLAAYGQDNPVDADVLPWILKHAVRLPPLRFDCGRDDRLIEHNRRLHQDLEVNGVEHVYEEFEGEHNWAYWNEHLADTLRFFERVLGNGEADR